MEDVKIRAWEDMSSSTIRMCMRQRNGTGDWTVWPKLDFEAEPKTRGRFEGIPLHECLAFDRESAQQMVDELFRLGFKPREHVPSENELTAVRSHLDDMRKIVFSALKPVFVVSQDQKQ